MSVIKPHIRKTKIFWYGIPCAESYICESKECFGFGESPELAYSEWLKRLPKTNIGLLVARFANKVIDKFV